MRLMTRARSAILAGVTGGLTVAALAAGASTADAAFYRQAVIPRVPVGQPVFVNVRVTTDSLGLAPIIGELRWRVGPGARILDLPGCETPLKKTISADGAQAVCSSLVVDQISLTNLGSSIFGVATLPRNNVAFIQPAPVSGRIAGAIDSRLGLLDQFPGVFFYYDVIS